MIFCVALPLNFRSDPTGHSQSDPDATSVRLRMAAGAHRYHHSSRTVLIYNASQATNSANRVTCVRRLASLGASTTTYTDGRDSGWTIALKCLASEMLPNVECRSRFRLIISAVLVQRMLPGSPHTGLAWALLTLILPVQAWPSTCASSSRGEP